MVAGCGSFFTGVDAPAESVEVCMCLFGEEEDVAGVVYGGRIEIRGGHVAESEEHLVYVWFVVYTEWEYVSML